jgi:hypothetical protein
MVARISAGRWRPAMPGNRKGATIMYGTITRYRIIPGQEGALEALSQEWLRERRAGVAGFIGEYLLISDRDPQERSNLVIFDSEENYRKNAADPEQDRWYRRFRALTEADPEWHDGTIVELAGAAVPL